MANALDTSIILGGQQPDIVATLQRAAQGGQQARQFKQRNALDSYLQGRGTDVMNGDPQAMNALAQFGVQGVEFGQGVQANNLNMDNTRQTMQARTQSMDFAKQQELRSTALHAATMTKTEREETDRMLRDGLMRAAPALRSGNLDAFNAILAEAEMEPINSIEEGMAVLSTVEGALTAITDYEAILDPQQERGPVRKSSIAPDGSTVLIYDTGPVVFDPMGEIVTGELAAQTMQAAADFEARNAGNKKTATDLGGVQADMVASSLATATQLQQSVGNIDTAIAALDRGANTGAIAQYLPNFSDESQLLQNSMNRMGLDIIGSVTFGALSEGELRLALTTALPTGLSEPALRTWLQERKDAQIAAAGMLSNAARFLSIPGNTINDWMAQNEQGEGGNMRGGSNPPPAAATQPAAEAPPAAAPTEAPSAAQFRTMPQGDLNAFVLANPDLSFLTDEQFNELDARLNNQGGMQ
jgi:hypothetical protein